MIYEIIIRDRLSDAMGTELGATELEERNGGTLLVIEIIDQSHLHGVLERLRDLNIEIESVNPRASDESRGVGVGPTA